MHTPGVRRAVLAGAAAVLAVAGLAGCRTSPSVAAYVGDRQISVAALERAVEDRTQNPDIAAVADQQAANFTRQVLSLLVLREVYTAAVERFGVDPVTDDRALAYLTGLVGADGVEQEFAQAAQQGLSRADVLELARERVLQAEIAVATGAGDALSEASLRARYQQNPGQYATYQVGYITVPDQATADAVLAQLQARPATYSAVAAGYAGPNTLPQLATYPAARLPAFADRVTATAPGRGFTAPLQGAGVVVGFVAAVTVAPFESVRDQVAQAARGAAEQAGQKAVAGFRDDLGVTVNPRYGVLNDQLVVEDTGGVVDILGGDAAAGSSPGSGPAGG